MSTKETKKPKSFRFDASDIKKLQALHKYYEREYKANLPDNMKNLYKWSEAQTIASLIRDRYESLVESGAIDQIEN